MQYKWIIRKTQREHPLAIKMQYRSYCNCDILLHVINSFNISVTFDISLRTWRYIGKIRHFDHV